MVVCPKYKLVDANPDVSVGIYSFNPLLMLQWIRKTYFKFFKTAALLGVLLAAVLLLISPAFPVFAQVAPTDIITESTQITGEAAGLPSLDIRVIIARIIRAVLGFIGIILLVLIIYGGYLYMTAGGNDEQIGKAKAILKNAAIGLAIILASYSIVLFIMKMLGVSFNDGSGGLNPPGTTNFVGSGALGRIIKDHYPERDQIDVARNTKIAITFRKPIRLEDLVDDVSDDGRTDTGRTVDGVLGVGDGILGNCITTSSFNWLDHCDRLKKMDGKLSDNLIDIKNIATGESIADAVITGAYITSTAGLPGGVYTIVLKPITNLADRATGGGYLGNTLEDTVYSVRLGKDIRLDDSLNDNPRAITASTADIRYGAGDNYYLWQFTVNTELDLTPPIVERVYPARNNDSAPKNSVIQIDFNEAIDPSGVQGEFTATSGYFALAGDNIFLKTDTGVRPAGNFVLTNGYRTLEFTPTTQCGVNTCGMPIYCLPPDGYELLLKAGQTINSSTFEALPFSGVMDMVGNALNGNKDEVVDVAPNIGAVFLSAGAESQWEKPDNDWWKFTIEDEMDLEPPYLINVHPGLDAGYVPPREPLTMLFSKLMRMDPLYDIEIRENPPQYPRLSKVPRASSSGGQTTVNMRHGPFLDGLRSDGLRQDYLPVVTSVVVDVNFNCFYPGKGPNESAGGDLDSADCVVDSDGNSTNCCAVTDNINNSFCCKGGARPSIGSSIENCINEP